jgi:multidrug efflux pump subunit AcrA (membrane-fusion protein)
MFCEAYFLHDKKKDVLAIPMESVNRNGGQASVFVVDSQNVVSLRPVKLGQESSTQVEVLSGLSEGERVIVGNLGEFTPGQKVLPKLVEAGTASEAGHS